MNHKFEFTGTLKNVPKDVLDKLYEMAHEPADSYEICIPNGDSYIHVATIVRNDDCPKELFNRVVQQLIDGQTK